MNSLSYVRIFGEKVVDTGFWGPEAPTVSNLQAILMPTLPGLRRREAVMVRSPAAKTVKIDRKGSLKVIVHSPSLLLTGRSVPAKVLGLREWTWRVHPWRVKPGARVQARGRDQILPAPDARRLRRRQLELKVTVQHHQVGIHNFRSLAPEHWAGSLAEWALRRPLKSVFLGMAGGEAKRLEARFVRILVAPTAQLARARLRRLEDLSLRPMLKDLLGRLRPIALGYGPSSLPWGADARIDALRLRNLRALKGSHATVTMRIRRSVWDGFLIWVGQEALNRSNSEIPHAKAVRTLVAGIAAHFGYRRAKDYLSSVVRCYPGEPRWIRKICALIAMRNAFEGVVDFESARWLISDGGRDFALGEKRGRWLPALLALRACRDSENKGAVFQIAAAIIHTLFRAETVGIMGTIQPRLPGMGDNQIELFGSDCPWPHGFRPPWPEGLNGPDPARVYALAGQQYGLSPRLLSIIFLDFRLTLALLYASSGNAITTRAALAAVPLSPEVELARRAILGLLKPPQATRSLLDAAYDTHRWDEGWDRFHASMIAHPDPSIVLGSPWWLVCDQYERQAAALIRQGRSGRETLLALRRLRRPDLADQLKPFWLLTEDDQEPFLFTGRWLAGDGEHPSDLDWPGLLETTCKEVLQEVR